MFCDLVASLADIPDLRAPVEQRVDFLFSRRDFY